MDKQIRKFKKIVSTYLYLQKENISKIWGKPSRHSDNEIWFYPAPFWSIFRDEVIFIFDEDIVVDVAIIRYFLWKEYQYIFYYENETPEYKIFRNF
ncbi:hypothetical protein ACFO4P_07615 [Epilithonimonas pallida]|uniref:Uncharacterized protein n=1 Tax=Epilithonimonas pallida TaxID=373671 RepID=A0ABY1R3F0_9FLAO|nr:hypothetical protein [Epilithonimonas pallida]SMP94187.1 hypothetical protein SAMN05421679_105269 [Epilithonimonas pallida]